VNPSLHQSFPSGMAIPCRSSTNNEDLPSFNGAGLYDSYTHHPHEGLLENTIKQVWASMWNYRAFEEREVYRIDHYQAAMGVLVHQNYQNARTNGVAVTKNVVDPNWKGYYVNVQAGEDLVTNPSDNAIPEEFLVSLLAVNPVTESYEYEIQYVRKSNRRVEDEPLLNQCQSLDLASRMGRIQAHFRRLYRRNDRFGMEIEFNYYDTTCWSSSKPVLGLIE
jgi:pyruvate,water dikinase